jgi:hypothetical protein
MAQKLPTLERSPSRQQVPERTTGRRNAVVIALIIVAGALAVFAAVRFLDREATGPEIVYGEETRANWDVTGIAAGYVLDVHAQPGATSDVIGTLAHDTAELESTGRIAHVDGVLWREIVVPGATTGWVEARYLTETAPPAAGEVPAAVVAMAAQIEQAARAADWDALAVLAFAGDTDFTATFGEEFTAPAELAAYWRGLATEEDLPRIMTALIALPDWYETQAVDADGAAVAIYVTPRFMHEPTAGNRAALEQALGAEWLDMQMADGQYLGWRLGITATGDWQFFVQGD